MKEKVIVSKQIPAFRLIILTVLTFGMYMIGWLFKNNFMLNEYDQESPNEILFFIPIVNLFAIYDQFNNLKEFLNKKKIKASWSVGGLILFFIIAGLFQMKSNFIDSTKKLIIAGLLTILFAIPMIKVQNSINKFYEKTEKIKAHWIDFNNNQIIWIICGVLMWVAMNYIIG